MSPRYPLVVDIRRASLHDGPGLRSVVFFKGCSLRCSFCQNPEAQDPRPEIAFFEGRCIACDSCAEACPNQAIRRGQAERIRRDRCARCGRCAAACPASALRRVGTCYSPGKLAEILLRDLSYYAHSGGGITLSGGECLLYPAYLLELLDLVEAPELTIAIETAGGFSWERAQPVLARADLIYYDIKLADPATHRRHTGKTNRRILRNLERLLRQGYPVEVRLPLIPGLTTAEANLRGVIAVLARLGARQISLLPYNPAGLQGYRPLGRTAPELPSSFQKPAEIEAIRERVRQLIEQARAELASPF